jgi:hypothetical protein
MVWYSPVIGMGFFGQKDIGSLAWTPHLPYVRKDHSSMSCRILPFRFTSILPVSAKTQPGKAALQPILRLLGEK